MSRKRKINFWSKRIQNEKTARQIANELNVDEEKIKELVIGEREIGGRTMDRVLNVIEDNKINGPMKRVEVLQWYRDTDIRALREEFGYTTRELAKKIGCNPSTISNFENRNFDIKRVGNRLIQLYDFYQDDFNRKGKASIDRQRKKVDKNNKHIWKWYKSTDIRALRNNMGMTVNELANKIYVSQSCLSDLERKNYKTVNKTMVNAYNFFVGSEVEKPLDDDMIMDWYKSVNDWGKYRRAFGYSLNKFMSELSLSYDQARTFERGNYKSASEVVRRIYNFYHNENKRLEPIEWEPKEGNMFVEYKESKNDNVDMDTKEHNLRLQYELEYTKKLNDVYEKIIDKLLTR